MLDIYEKAFAERPEVKDPRFRIEHAQILDAADIPRFGKLGVLASMQGIHCPSDRPWAPKRLGDARVAEGAYVWRKLLDSGARILNGTDAPVEDVSPIQNFHASVTRAAPRGQPPGGFDPDQKLTPRGGAPDDDARRRLRRLRGDARRARSRSASSPTSSCSRRTSCACPTTRS